MVPRPAKQLFENCEGKFPTLPNAILESVNNVCTKEEVEELKRVLSECGIKAGIADRKPLQSSQSTILSLQEIDETPMRELHQHFLPEGFNASTKEILHKIWASIFYEENIHFNMVRHPTFIHAMQKTTRLRMHVYTPPSNNAERTRLLTTKRVDVEEKLGNSIGKYGVIICSRKSDRTNVPRFLFMCLITYV